MVIHMHPPQQDMTPEIVVRHHGPPPRGNGQGGRPKYADLVEAAMTKINHGEWLTVDYATQKRASSIAGSLRKWAAKYDNPEHWTVTQRSLNPRAGSQGATRLWVKYDPQ